MNNILDRIVSVKKAEVEKAKTAFDLKAIKDAGYFMDRDCISLKDRLMDEDGNGIIAEFKKRSPSKGWIYQDAPLERIIPAYGASAAGISVLTDEEFFGGHLEDLKKARSLVSLPLLRKDFMIDPFQLLQAKAYGADVILLIAAILRPHEVQALAKEAKQLGLEVLLEIHQEDELGHICDEVDMVGVNNRNLKTFEVDIRTSLDLVDRIPLGKPAVAESGITNVETIVSLKRAGFRGFLIGEQFMKQDDPAIAFAALVQQLKAKNEN
jgi:indole-3-glycerol phosphate synthase